MKIPFGHTEVGAAAGYGLVAVDGYVWSSDLRVPADLPADLEVKGDFGLPLVPGYKGPWLLQEGTTNKRYPLLKDRRVLYDFVRLGKDPGQAKVLEFANRWGWLGNSYPVEDKSGTGAMLFAEPLALWEIESKSFTALWDTWEAVRTLSDPDAPAHERPRAKVFLGDRVQWRSRQSVVFTYLDGPIKWREVIAHQDTAKGPGVLSRWKYGDTLEPARYYVCDRVNRCLYKHIQMAVLPFLGSRVRFLPDSLRTALYMHFAFELAGVKGEERTCDNLRCPNGGVFFPSRRDQRHCDKQCRELAAYYRRQYGIRAPPQLGRRRS